MKTTDFSSARILRTSAAIPLFPLYTFLVWIGTTLSFLLTSAWVKKLQNEVKKAKPTLNGRYIFFLNICHLQGNY